MKTYILLFASLTFCTNFLFAQNSGTVDPTFGLNGFTEILINEQDGGADNVDMIVLPDDKIAMIGYTMNLDYDFFVTVLNPNGQFDQSFGNMGTARYDFTIGGEDLGFGIAAQDDGKMLFTGALFTSEYELLVGRLNQDGSLDTTFDHDGTLLLSPSTYAVGYEIALDHSNKIVVASVINDNGMMHWQVYRFNQDGSIDNNFGNAGSQLIDLATPGIDDRWISGMSIGVDNSIYISGSDNELPRTSFIRKLDNAGNLVNSFGTSGTVMLQKPNFDFRVNDIKVDDDGTLWTIASEETSNGDRVALMKMNSDGQFNNTFGTNGKLMVNIPNADAANGQSLARIGNNVLITGTYTLNGYHVYTAMVSQDGTFNTNFGNQGISTANPGSFPYGTSQNIALQSSGNIILGVQHMEPNLTFVPGVIRLVNTETMNIQENVKDINMDVYPNPLSNYFMIDLSSENTIQTINLLDLSGRTICTWAGSQTQYDLPTNILSGTYFIQIYTNNSVTNKTIVINN